MITYLIWWYAQEPPLIFRSIGIVTKKVFSSFSIGILAGTLFDPWKRDVAYAENSSLDVRLKIAMQNLLSRFIGFIVRLITILVGLFCTIVIFIFMVLAILLWLLMPVIIVFLFINGIRSLNS